MFVCLFVYLCVCLFFSVFVYLFVCVFVYLLLSVFFIVCLCLFDRLILSLHRPSIYSAQISLPEPLEGKELLARSLYPWRSFLER